MLLDLSIVLIYFAAVMFLALRGRQGTEATTEEYFLSSRSLPWYSVAISTIATNVQGYQFLGMMGSAYLYGLAQANLEINAMQGILMAAFIFVPMYLRDKVVTISQFIKNRLGEWVALLYSVANIVLFSTIGLGAALFWGAYAADLVFGEYLAFISADRLVRVTILLIGLGVFSAIYTYLGGLTAVVKTDIIQFTILLIGGTVVLFVSIYHLGGWGQLYEKTPELMTLHLPAEHEKLPWTLIFGLGLLNINYWCANQTVIQRSLAARSLKDAQMGLMAGGLMKYFMAIIIIVPGIALAGILQDMPLTDPDEAYPYIIREYLLPGIRGIILCALFASLMSTVDSTFNSLATLFSIDIYKQYINPQATDKQVVSAGRNTILVTLLTGISMGILLLYIKVEDIGGAFTHTLNSMRYFFNCGFVVIICAAVFLLAPRFRLVLFAALFTVVLNLLFLTYLPDMNYFVRAGWVILLAFILIPLGQFIFQLTGNTRPKTADVTVLDDLNELKHNETKGIWKKWDEIFESASPQMAQIGLGLFVSLLVLHLVFH